MKHKKLFVALIAIFSVLVFLGTFVIIWFWGDRYEDFEEFSSAAEIPGLADGAVPQGLANYTTSVYDENGAETGEMQEYYFISAYMKEGASRIYVTGAKTGYVGYVTLQNEDGSDYTGHCGGIATSSSKSYTSGTLWITSDGVVYCAKRSSGDYKNIGEEVIAKAKLYGQTDENDKPLNVIKFTASFNANCRADFCFHYDSDGDPMTISSINDKFYVGEFYRPGNAETALSHRITTDDGAENNAFVYEYNVSSSTEYGLSTLTSTEIAPEMQVPKIQKILSVPERIQGFARVRDTAAASPIRGKLILSQSWGLTNSTVYYYDWYKINTDNSEPYGALVKNVDADGNETAAGFEYFGVTKKSGAKYFENPTVYFVDESALEREYSIPSMSEGMCVSDNKVYVLFESGSYKYKTFVRRRVKNLYYFIPRQ